MSNFYLLFSDSIGVTEVNFFLQPSYGVETFDSCKTVSMPLANQLALDLMCGRPASACTPEVWFEFLGDANKFAPFQINYKFRRDAPGFKPLNIPTHGCAERPTVCFLTFLLKFKFECLFRLIQRRVIAWIAKRVAQCRRRLQNRPLRLSLEIYRVLKSS